MFSFGSCELCLGRTSPPASWNFVKTFDKLYGMSGWETRYISSSSGSIIWWYIQALNSTRSSEKSLMQYLALMDMNMEDLDIHSWKTGWGTTFNKEIMIHYTLYLFAVLIYTLILVNFLARGLIKVLRTNWIVIYSVTSTPLSIIMGNTHSNHLVCSGKIWRKCYLAWCEAHKMPVSLCQTCHIGSIQRKDALSQLLEWRFILTKQ